MTIIIVRLCMQWLWSKLHGIMGVAVYRIYRCMVTLVSVFSSDY